MLNYNTLYLTSGGIYGYSLLGTLHVLEKKNLLHNFKKIMGSSVGSIISFLITLKYSCLDIFKVLKSNNLEYFYIKKKLEKDNILLNLINYLGFTNSNGIIRIIELFLKEKKLKLNITFKELYDFNNIELIILSSNLTKNKLEYFSYKNTPEYSVINSIRCSISIPLLFTPIIYNNNLMVDSAFFEFKKNKYVNNNTLTIRIHNNNLNLDIQNINISNYILYLMNYLIKNSLSTNDNKNNTLFLHFKESGINFSINYQNKKDMFNYGIKKMINFLVEKKIKKKYFLLFQKNTIKND